MNLRGIVVDDDDGLCVCFKRFVLRMNVANKINSSQVYFSKNSKINFEKDWKIQIYECYMLFDGQRPVVSLQNHQWHGHHTSKQQKLNNKI